MQDDDLEVYGSGKHEIKNTGRGTFYLPLQPMMIDFLCQAAIQTNSRNRNHIFLVILILSPWGSNDISNFAPVKPGDLGLANQSIICHAYYVQVWAYDPS